MDVVDVNRLLKQFEGMQSMMKALSSGKLPMGMMGGMGGKLPKGMMSGMGRMAKKAAKAQKKKNKKKK
jgi:signal recognition particle subunit SRP54